jgi:hypothetical protein
MADVDWVHTAPSLVSAAFWQAAAVRAASCAGWRKPSASQVFSPDGDGWWQRHLRLGHHFEKVHAALLAAQPGFVVHAVNLPLHGKGVTLGELDCLYADASGTVIHREVAVKYYLSCRDSQDVCHWIGTGKVDRLDLKLQRMVAHQTQLSLLAEQMQLWPAAIPFPSVREVFVTGAFFRHASHGHWPSCMAEDAERGFWCTTGELLEEASQPDAWVILDKPWWLSPTHIARTPTTNRQTIASRIEASREPLLVASIERQRLGQRGFVVPNDW